ncbi:MULTISPECIES: ABC transporter ATP-binding protein [Clostridium]|uniref:Cobalt ABC transporter ATP-binding protein n=2 Tax=Clostridium TaxID=1485 RepID=A0A0D1BYL2_CLOBO|nr:MULTISPECIES: energy-coupling factor transporter ATPase [Clostridium]MBE6075832.1 ABC transporter ATP-binding protein [Clostridium lundense]MDU2831424.1 energy-coupling factor transporter ATPase [Clostridium botulinum]KIS23911.1 cobalt ABC transporter ATP-binding protein [Clostridium botulinum B2 450]MCW7998410.1 ABC transporter ATP-binding protein [Clostridium sp. cpc1]MDU4545829.1 energy-coupling factor transporter ATPase [Clostridium botulinum]
MLEIKNLSLSFQNNYKVFKDINIKVKKNRVTLLTGKSGCGKSSLLMCITGVIPDIIEGNITGEIIYKDENIENKGVKTVSGEIAYMFQDPDSQLCTFTVEDEIAFGLENIKMEPSHMDPTIDKVLKLTGIKHLRKRQLNHLSGGEKQKVALASILALDPEVILMDEPTANLDPKSTMEIINLIKDLRDKFGKTILIVEHKINEFSEIIDDIIWFQRDYARNIDKEFFIQSYKSESTLPAGNKNQSTTEKVLEAKEICFSYNKNSKVLKNVNFSLRKGEIAAIIGPNGAGKSTLSKILMGLLKAEKGDILVKDINIKNINPRELGEHMGLVFQNPEHQFIKMTVEKEMALSLEIRKQNSEIIKNTVDSYLSMFDLANHRLSNPFSLSQGQKRRLSTASMMINGQSILILDEPTYGQDRTNLKELINLLYKINSEGTSILMITHDMDMVLNCCDRVIYLENGEVKYEGSPKNMKENIFT